MSYCKAAREHPYHGPYHDQEHGFPLEDDDQLFERLILEINQAGLSWLTVLKKREGLRRAYSGFSIDAVAGYGEADRQRLLGDASIIRNRLKIDAAIANARTLQELQRSHGSFAAWLAQQHPLSREAWTRLFRRTFRFTGGEIVNEFLMSIGYLPGAHEESCPVHARVLAARPAWHRAEAERCPLCGELNRCARAASAAATDCWCFSAVIPEAVRAGVPERAQRCICARCATGERGGAGNG